MKFLSDRDLCREVAVEAQIVRNPPIQGLYARLTSEATPTSIGHLIGIREVGIEFSPMWRGSAGDPCCAVTRGRDG